MNALATADYISAWLKDYCVRNGQKGYVVGVSGGIDSAVTSTLCARTGLPTTVVSLPIYQPANQHSRSLEHCEALAQRFDNVSPHTLDLSGIFAKMEADFPAQIQDHLSMANARARLRMLTLYTYANSEGALVAGTGNKVEDFGVGFFTKYGDGGVDVSPIADLMKSQVYALAEVLDVSKDIIDAPPTDGLWDDDRSDEDQLGASYDELEWAMRYVEQGEPVADLDARQQQVLEIYTSLHRKNLHKMQPIPVCVVPKEILGDL